MIWLYNVFIQLYVAGIRIASLRNKKAKEWISGRKENFSRLEKEIQPHDKTIWFHCASAGELEQGKPLIEALKTDYPAHKIIISFFSPSGYQVAKKYPFADVITYLPVDTRKNARRFVDLVHPELVIFVKYEYWFHHLSAVAFRHIPLILVSAIFRKEQPFFRWYGNFFRQLLFLFRQLFVQDETSLQLLKERGINHCSIGGDTRFDRVKKIADKFDALPFIANSVEGSRCIVAGSTWKEDEELIRAFWQSERAPGLKLIIAPHEISDARLKELENLFPGAAFYPGYENKDRTSAQVIIINTVGLLSRLYRYADITYVGGGFNKSGIHNTLEAAVYGKPVIFGPHYQKFKEARELVGEGGAASISTATELEKELNDLLSDPEKIKASGEASKNYVARNTGATKKILSWIQANRLLTR